MGRCLSCKQEIGVRFPNHPLKQNGRQPDTGRRVGLLHRNPQGYKGSNPLPSANFRECFRLAENEHWRSRFGEPGP